MSSIVQAVRQLDGYAKTLDDFRVKTMAGATVTLISGFLIFTLLISEFGDYRSIETKQALVVDTTRGEKLTINLDVTFPRIPCYLLSIDVMDVAGEHQNDIDHDIYKVRLTRDGQPVEDKEKAKVGSKEVGVEKRDENYCGSCYGGQVPENGCCNTCEEVRESYRRKGWSFTDPDGIEQCVREGWSEKIKDQAAEGCNMHGYVEVSKVAGNFHFAPGKSFQQNHMHLHDLHPYLSNKFDFSHKINHLSFGKLYPDSVSTLDSVEKQTSKSNYMYQYFVKVVPTRFIYLDKTELLTNQYSATQHERDLSAGGPGGLPGVFFNYDISPMMVIYTQEHKSFLAFLTGVCAIVGGIFTVAGIIDGVIYTAEKSLKKKMELGKAS